VRLASPEKSQSTPVGEQGPEVNMRFEDFSFGSIRIDGVTYEYDVVIDRGKIGKRNKKASKKFRDEFGHTPVSIEEEIPWKCRRLVVGTGTHRGLPVMKEVKNRSKAPQNRTPHASHASGDQGLGEGR
jgi:hypothetical protein